MELCLPSPCYKVIALTTCKERALSAPNQITELTFTAASPTSMYERNTSSLPQRPQPNQTNRMVTREILYYLGTCMKRVPLLDEQKTHYSVLFL